MSEQPSQLVCGDFLGADDGVAKSDGSVVRETWLQLIVTHKTESMFGAFGLFIE